MTTTTIRHLQGEEMLAVMYGLNAYCFRSSPPMVDRTEWEEPVRERQGTTYVAMFEDSTPVAGAAASPMTQNVRGARYAMGGLWAVATHPASRRKGYAKSIIAELLAHLRNAGCVFSTLYPFRESFYERLGYVTFPLPRKAVLLPGVLAPLLNRDLGGKVDLTLFGEGYDAYRAYVQSLQPHIHGMGVFDHGAKKQAERSNLWMAQAKAGGELIGVMLYDLKGENLAEYNMRVVRFCYSNSLGKYLLLSWIARHVDQANRVEIWLPPSEQPETWLADMQVKTESEVRAPMGRVLDVAKLGGMRCGPGSFSARISDPLCPWNNGVWRFEATDGVLHVSTAAQQDCDISIQALAGLVYGTHDAGDFAIRGWGDPPPALQTTMRAMFPAMLPYLHERF